MRIVTIKNYLYLYSLLIMYSLYRLLGTEKRKRKKYMTYFEMLTDVNTRHKLSTLERVFLDWYFNYPPIKLPVVK